LDDHELIIEGLRSDLHGNENIVLVGHNTDARIGLEEILANRDGIDVVITDVDMPHITGFQVCDVIKSSGPLPRVAFLTYHMNDETRYKAKRTQMDGMTYKNATKLELIAFIESVHSGKSVVVDNVPTSAIPITSTTPLTSREKEVLYYLACKGLTNAEVADLMHRSKDTIETHRKNIMSKLDLKNTVEMVHYALSVDVCNNPPSPN